MTNLQLTAHAFLARYTLAHFECHSSHRGLAFGVDSPAPGACTLGVESYPYPNEVDCLNEFIYYHYSACIVYLLSDYSIILYEDIILFPFYHLNTTIWMTYCLYYSTYYYLCIVLLIVLRTHPN